MFYCLPFMGSLKVSLTRFSPFLSHRFSDRINCVVTPSCLVD